MILLKPQQLRIVYSKAEGETLFEAEIGNWRGTLVSLDSTAWTNDRGRLVTGHTPVPAIIVKNCWLENSTYTEGQLKMVYFGGF